MKIKMLLAAALPLLCLACAGNQKKFEVNTSLVSSFEGVGLAPDDHEPPYIAVFKKGGKTLVYLATRHNDNRSMQLADYIFASYKPQIAVVEMPHSAPGRVRICSGNEFDYIPALASVKNIPVTFADITSQEKDELLVRREPKAAKTLQARWVIANLIDLEKKSGKKVADETLEKEIERYKNKNHNPAFGQVMTAQEFKAWFKENLGRSFDDTYLPKFFDGQWNTPKYKGGTVFNRLADDSVRYGRDPFMLKNITAALNKYGVVFAAFGQGHYRTQREALEDMLGLPEYTWNIAYDPNYSCGVFNPVTEVFLEKPF